MFTTSDALAAEARAGMDARDADRARDAVDRLVRAHKARVYGLCLRVTQDPEQALALTRSVVHTACGTLPRLDLEHERAWIWLADLTWRTACRAVRVPGDPLVIDGVIAPTDATARALRGLSNDARGAVLDRATQALDARVQELAHLRYVLRMDHRGIEGLTGCGNARNALDPVRGTLQRALGQQALGQPPHGGVSQGQSCNTRDPRPFHANDPGRAPRILR